MQPALNDVIATIDRREDVTYWLVGTEGGGRFDATPLGRDVALGRCRELGRENRVRAWIQVDEGTSGVGWQLVYDPEAIE